MASDIHSASFDIVCKRGKAQRGVMRVQRISNLILEFLHFIGIFSYSLIYRFLSNMTFVTTHNCLKFKEAAERFQLLMRITSKHSSLMRLVLGHICTHSISTHPFTTDKDDDESELSLELSLGLLHH